MTKLYSRRPLRLCLHFVTTSIVVAFHCACSPGATADAQPNTTPNCTPGLERCECLPSGGCDRDLECRSGLCVAALLGASSSEVTDTHSSTTAPDVTTSTTLEATDATLTSVSLGTGLVTTEPAADVSTAPSASSAVTSAHAVTLDTAPSSNSSSLPVDAPDDPFANNDPHCGDGVLDAMEVCDDGNNMNDDGCKGDCSAPEPAYSCPIAGGRCLLFAVCGDAWPSANEPCDDGNLVDGDGCSSRCTIELGLRCEGQPSVCVSNPCGDGLKAGIESCDDGNTLDGDGCNEECQLERCDSGAPACENTCGDGVVETEDCDDGNTLDGDGCDTNCQVEEGFTCSNDVDFGSECVASCGDAVVVFGEQCDDGINDGGYGECGVGCVVGDRCGDGILQPENESCDVGSTNMGGCLNCKIAP